MHKSSEVTGKMLEGKREELWDELAEHCRDLPLETAQLAEDLILEKKESADLWEGERWHNVDDVNIAKLHDHIEEEMGDSISAESDFARAKLYGDFEDIESPDYSMTEPAHGIRRAARLSGMLVQAVRMKNAQKAREALESVLNNAENLEGILPQVLEERIGDIVSELVATEPVLILDCPAKDEKIQLPKLIRGVNSIVFDLIVKDPDLLYRLSPRAFEEFVAEIFSGFGYTVELTARTRDGGKDLVAIRKDHGVLSKLIVECKRFSPPRKVGISYIRQLYAVRSLERASKAVLATTTTFTAPARDFERKHIYELELKDRDAILGWAREYSNFLRSLKQGGRT